MTQSRTPLFMNRLKALLGQVYPDADRTLLAAKVVDAFWPNAAPRRVRPRQPGNGLWSQRDSILITYGNSIVDGDHRPLTLLHDFLNSRLRGVIGGVHVLPFFPFTSDDGFAVTDYDKVDPALGDWDDISRIGADFTLMSDLVLNHVSSQGPWFEAFRRGLAPHADFFVTAAPDADLSQVTRPRTTPLLQEVDTPDGPRHVWCTFSHDQVDLNFANPDVLLEMLKIIRLHVNAGVRILRLDAVAFLWKEIGTTCVHLPQTHALVKLLRLLADFAIEPLVLLTETNVPRAENLSYFGDHDEAHAVYNFPLPPLVLHAMLSGSAKYLQDWSRAMPPAPLGATYLNFTASHDGIGMRPVEGLLPEAEIARLIDTVTAGGGRTSLRGLPDGGTAVYELNTSYFDAMHKTFDGADSHKIDRFLCSQTIVMALEGIPAFYIHALLATPNDHAAVARSGVNRAINRHRWDHTSLRAALADPASEQAIVLGALSGRLRLRRRQPAFHPNAPQYTLQLDHRVLAVWRQSLDRRQTIFALHNVSAGTVRLPTQTLNLIEDETWRDLFTGETVQPGGDDVVLGPYQCRWISNTAPD